MEFNHTPVLLAECVEHLAVRPDGVYVDGTLGGGGHGRAICARLSQRGIFIGIDRDQEALEAAKERLAEYPAEQRYVHRDHRQIREILEEEGVPAIDGAILDLGVSSYQLDRGERGFAYMQDAPLDMRMDRCAEKTGLSVVNEYSQAQLAEIIRKYGEERWAERIASFIVRERQGQPILRTGRLVEIIKAAIPASARREGPHPAKRTFQAIRIEVNDELDGLTEAVEGFLDVLAPGGRLCIITFHSLEDRIVKEHFRRHADPCTCPPGLPCICGKTPDIRIITRKPLVADGREIEANPRARSAKLRVAEKR